METARLSLREDRKNSVLDVESYQQVVNANSELAQTSLVRHLHAGFQPFLDRNTIEAPISPDSERGQLTPLDQSVDSRPMDLQKVCHFPESQNFVHWYFSCFHFATISAIEPWYTLSANLNSRQHREWTELLSSGIN